MLIFNILDLFHNFELQNYEKMLNDSVRSIKIVRWSD